MADEELNADEDVELKPHLQLEASEGDLENEDVRGFRQQLAVYVASSVLSIWLDLLNALLSLLSCVNFIVTTYGVDEQSANALAITETVLLGYFVVDFCFRVLTASEILKYFLTPNAWVDIVTVLPGVVEIFLQAFMDGGNVVDLNFLRFVRVLRVLRLLRLNRLMGNSDDETVRQKSVLTLSVVTILFISAGLMQVLESQIGNSESRPFHDWLYFVIVLTSGVGYGDIRASETQSKLIVLLIFALTISIVSAQVQKSGDARTKRQAFSSYSYRLSSRPHIVVSGKLSAACLKDFLREFYHPEHDPNETDVVVFLETVPDAHMIRIADEASAQGARSVYLLHGDAGDETSLQRSRVEEANAVFVLADKFAPSAIEADASVVIIALSLQQYLQARAAVSTRMIVQMILPESRDNFANSYGLREGDSIFSVEELRQSLLARSVSCPGFSSLIATAIASSSVSPSALPVHIRRNLPSWLQHFLASSAQEFYFIVVPTSLMLVKYSEVCTQTTQSDNGLIVGLICQHQATGRRQVLMNPFSSVIPTGLCHFIVIADNAQEARSAVTDVATAIEARLQSKGAQSPLLATMKQKFKSSPDLSSFSPALSPGSPSSEAKELAAMTLGPSRKDVKPARKLSLTAASNAAQLPLQVPDPHASEAALSSRSNTPSEQRIPPLSLDEQGLQLSGRRSPLITSVSRPTSVTRRVSRARNSSMSNVLKSAVAKVSLSRANSNESSSRQSIGNGSASSRLESVLMRAIQETKADSSLQISSLESNLYHELSFRLPVDVCRVKNDQQLKNHVIIFASSHSVAPLVRMLCRKSLKSLYPILVVHDTGSKWFDPNLTRYPGVFLLEADLRDQRSVAKLCIPDAAAVIFLPRLAANGLESEFADTPVVFAYNTVKAMNPKIMCHAEVQSTFVLRLLSTSAAAEPVPSVLTGDGLFGDALSAPPFVSGEVLASAMYDVVVAQSYFHPMWADVVSWLACADRSEEDSSSGSELWTVSSNELGCVGLSVKQARNQLAQRGILIIGVGRPRSDVNDKCILLNPSGFEIEQDDELFVFSESPVVQSSVGQDCQSLIDDTIARAKTSLATEARSATRRGSYQVGDKVQMLDMVMALNGICSTIKDVDKNVVSWAMDTRKRIKKVERDVKNKQKWL